MNVFGSHIERQALALACAILVAGSGTMSLISRIDVPAGLANWQDFTATTVGDTVLLPVLASSLFAGWRFLATATSSRAPVFFALGALTGGCGGALVQASWLLDDSPRLTWVLPQVHRFSWQGWYHAGFLVTVTTLIFGLTSAVSGQLLAARRASLNSTIVSAARSPLLIAVMASVWLFSIMIVHDGGAGTSLTVTTISVVTPTVVTSCAAFALLGSSVLRSLAVAAFMTVAAAVVLVTIKLDVHHLLAVVLSGSVAVGVTLRNPNWRKRLAECALLALGVLGVTLTAIAISEGILLACAVCLVGVSCVLLLLTRLLAAWIPHTATLDLPTASAVAALSTTLPVAAWLAIQPEANLDYADLIVIIYSVTLMPVLMPSTVKRDTRQLLKLEKASSSVTKDPALSEDATRVAVRASAWGLAALCGLLTVVVAAGPSMGFEDGTGRPSLRLGVIAVLGTIGAVSFILVAMLRGRPWVPVIPCVSGLLVLGVSAYELTSGYGSYRWWPIFIPLVLVLLWELESIVANAAMRPSWVIRRVWRLPVGVVLSLAVTASLALAVIGGTYGTSGSPTPLLQALSQLLAIIAINLLLTLSAGWSLDWRDSLMTHPPSVGVENWARYRMRSSILQDFGLLQLLVVLGIWLPVSALTRAGGHVGGVVLACTGMLFFGPVFFLSLRNSVLHIEEQSHKAGRKHSSILFGTFPRVSRAEEIETLKAMVTAKEGPDTQSKWATVVAVHQLHLNVLALGMALISAVGALPFLGGVRDDA